MRHFLDFEKPLAELEGKIEELRHLSNGNQLNIADEVARLETKVDRLLRQRADVLAFASAPEAMGGTGAVLVLLARKRPGEQGPARG